MITIHKKLFYDLDKNIDLYNEFMNVVSEDYTRYIKKILNSKSIEELRRNIHSLIGIVGVFETSVKNELLYFCKISLQLDKNDKTITIENYTPYIKQIVDFDKTKLCL